MASLVSRAARRWLTTSACLRSDAACKNGNLRKPVPVQAFLRQPRQQWQHRYQSQYRRPSGYSSSRSPIASLMSSQMRGSTGRRNAAIILIGGSIFYVYNLEEVPVSGRKRFNIVSESFENQQGEAMYQEILRQYRGKFLSQRSPQYQLVARALRRLLPHTGLSSENNKWEIHVINDSQPNAFVIPGGKVFFFTGIFDVCRDEQGVAAVLGHEIAHNVAHHSAESMSKSYVLIAIGNVVSVILGWGDLGDYLTRITLDLAFLKPGSRKQESEADYIGLMMMSEACYDPRAALQLWSRMEKIAESEIPQFLSTHPSNHNRLEQISTWLEKADAKRQESGCASIYSTSRDFQNSLGIRW